MEHITEINEKTIEFLENNIFPSIYKSDTILFLGAGASVTNKQFLGNDIIEYYEDKLGVDLKAKDLVEFVDLLSAIPNFNRNDLDNYVLKLISGIEVSAVHKSIASIQWREIITTNYDLLVERAFDEQSLKSSRACKIRPVRCKEEYAGYNTASEIKYVKLNGCASDNSKYHFVLSTKDFNDSKKYYRTIFSSLENLSPSINFLSIGFSFSDGLSNYLIEKFDSYNYRNKKWMYSIDPFVNNFRLPYYTEKKICIIKIFPEEFFKLYQNWVETKAVTLVKRKNISYTNSNNNHLIIPAKLTLSLGENLTQLADSNAIHSIIQKEFYKGNRPTYDVIRRNYDIFKSSEVKKATLEIEKILNQTNERIIPILFLEGHFGNGKSTFTYRVIHSLLHELPSSIAFEIYEPEKLSESDLIELFTLSKEKNIIILCNELEIDSHFKSLMNLRNRLSSEQFSEFNMIFLTSIRENILMKQLKKNSYKNIHKLNMKLKFEKVEAVEFVEKLSSVGLINYKDNIQKNILVEKVLKDYNGEAFISLLGLIKNQDNHLEIILEDAYKQLSEKGKEAVLFTSILYQFKILMPASVLMKIVSKDWDSFKLDIMDDDCKGILIQEITPSNGTEPDLYFRTKHSLLSEHLVKSMIKSEDKLYEKIRKLFDILSDSEYTSTMVVNLLKALRDYSRLNQEKINKLYDFIAKEFEASQHFNLNYAINLQTVRRDEVSLKTALNRLSYSGDLKLRRNHRIIHRRASINFDLAKLYFENNKAVEYEHYVSEARELFKIKVIEDPCSSYSYFDYICFELWCLKNMKYEEADLLRQHILIQDLFDIAENAVYEDIEKITSLKATYIRVFNEKKLDNNKTLLQYLDELYELEETRPLSLVLKYNYLIESEKYEDADNLITEMLYYKYNDEVAKVLFKYYGRNLHISQNVVNFFEIVNENPILKTKEKLRFHFYSFVAESYNRAFKNTFEHLNEIKLNFNYLNPNVSEYWIDSNNNEPKIFDAILVKNQKGRTQAKIIELQQSFFIKKTDIEINFKENTRFKVNLTFNLRGIRAEIISNT